MPDWVIKHRSMRWWIGRGDNRTDAPYKLTQHEKDAAPFPSEEEAERARVRLDFAKAYESVQRGASK